MGFAVSEDLSVKIKENEKRNKYFDFARELKKIRDMKVTVIPVVIGVLGTVYKGLEKGTWRVRNWRTSPKPSKPQRC